MLESTEALLDVLSSLLFMGVL